MSNLLKVARSLDQLVGLHESDPLVFYRPYSKQTEFHRARAAIRAVLGGNRVGKTTMGIAEDVMIALGTHPYMQAPLPNRGRIGVTDFKVLEQVLWPKLQQFLPLYEVREFRKGAKGVVTGVQLKNGSFFDILSYEQLPMKWESVDLDWVHFDEPPTFAIWQATRARLIDRDGRVWFTLTPLEEPWLAEEVWERCGTSPRFWGSMIDMRDNPYLSKVAVASYIDEVSVDDFDARVLGNFRHLTGRVLKDFTDDYPYVVTPEQLPLSPDWPRMLVVDPHEKTSWALQWYAYWEEADTVIRHDEHRHNPADGIKVFGNIIKNKELLHNARVPDHMRIIDTYAFKPTYNVGGNSLADEIRELTGYDFMRCDKSDMDSRLWDLIYRYKINSATHLPRIITYADCMTARKEVRNYVWDKHRTKAGQYAEEKQNPVKKNDHALSCDHYMSAIWPSTKRVADPSRLVYNMQGVDDPIPGMAFFKEAEGNVITVQEVRQLVRACANQGRRGSRRRRSHFTGAN